MKSNISKGLLFISILLLLLSVPLAGSAATMRDYCQTPPFIGSGGEPNLLVLDDVSGSMGWSAYGNNNSGTPPSDSLYNAATTYEGYFVPDKNYVLESDGITYRETSGIACSIPAIASKWNGLAKKMRERVRTRANTEVEMAVGCSGTKPYHCCTATTTSGDCSPSSGNYLNFKNMHRIDLIRWALTGGQPATCDTFASNKCDPEIWKSNTGAGLVGTVCNDSLDVNGDGTAEGGCILSMDNGDTGQGAVGQD